MLYLVLRQGSFRSLLFSYFQCCRNASKGGAQRLALAKVGKIEFHKPGGNYLLKTDFTSLLDLFRTKSALLLLRNDLLPGTTTSGPAYANTPVGRCFNPAGFLYPFARAILLLPQPLDPLLF